jgi:hypothetical protein
MAFDVAVPSAFVWYPVFAQFNQMIEAHSSPNETKGGGQIVEVE